MRGPPRRVGADDGHQGQRHQDGVDCAQQEAPQALVPPAEALRPAQGVGDAMKSIGEGAQAMTPPAEEVPMQ